jgi:hypothetical protein
MTVAHRRHHQHMHQWAQEHKAEVQDARGRHAEQRDGGDPRQRDQAAQEHQEQMFLSHRAASENSFPLTSGTPSRYGKRI